MKPMEIADQEFAKKALGGYDPLAVRGFLRRVAEEVHDLQTQLQMARGQNDQLKQEAGRSYREENTIAAVMLRAEQAGQELRREAESEAMAMRQSAQREAERIRMAAHEEATLITQSARVELKQMETRLAMVRRVLTEQLEQVVPLVANAVSSLQAARDFGVALQGAAEVAVEPALPGMNLPELHLAAVEPEPVEDGGPRG